MGIYLDNFDYLSQEIDSLFSVPNTLRELFISVLMDYKQDKIPMPTGTHARSRLDNVLKAFENIKDESVRETYEEQYGKLYENAFVLLISSSEMILREIYDEIFFDRFDTLSWVKDMDLKVSDLDLSGGSISKEAIIKLIKRKKYEDKNPSTKLYFENIKAIESQFNNLGIKINLTEGDVGVGLHEYYQYRHILIHQRGKIDQIFVDNIRAAGLDVSSFRVGTRLQITDFEYDRCKQLLRQLIQAIELELAAKK